MKNISLDLVRATEAAAVAASKWIGSGEKEEADRAATNALRGRLNRMDFHGRVIIGEGEKDNSYGLFFGEELGSLSKAPVYDIGVDPIEGTRPTVTSGPEAISTIALSSENSMYQTDSFYMYKISYGQKIKNKNVELSLSNSLHHNLRLVSMALNKSMNDIVVCVLDRPRHKDIIEELRENRVRIKLIQDCDISGAVATCLLDSGVDLMYGIGGSPEAIVSACALKCMGGGMEAQVVDESKGWATTGDILTLEDLVKGPCIFAATGITDGSILRGVRFRDSGYITNSVFMRSESGTIRWFTTQHGKRS
tara:strand:+ start:268 stop:1191 length:924 start_codon:yes stop_codon:yes gene_type:complete